MTTKKRPEVFTPNAAAVISKAESLAYASGAYAVGTEHILAALIEKDNVGAVTALTRSGVDIAALRAAVGANMVPPVASAPTKWYDQTPSVVRCLEIASSLAQPVTTEGLLAALLLADKEVPNFASKILRQVCPQVLLMGYDSAAIPQRSIAKFGISWDAVSAGPKGQPAILHSAMFPKGNPALDGVHPLLPGVYCGRAPMQSGSTSAGLKALVSTLGVNVFVCFQQDYTEYGCTDYRIVLRNWKEAPHEVRFLFCPIPDFGVIDDQHVMVLIDELRRLIDVEKATLYLHCYGGHGRTGTVATHLLGAYTGTGDVAATLQRLKGLHAHRAECRQRHCGLNEAHLEDESQTAQVANMHKLLTRGQKLH